MDTIDYLEDTQTYLPKIILWLHNQGIETKLVSFVGSSFLDEVEIEEGKLLYTSRTSISNLLHEAGHLAVAPSFARPYLDGEVEESLQKCDIDYPPDSVEIQRLINGGEQAAIAWSYAVVKELQIPEYLLFTEGFGTEESIESVRLGLKLSTHPGISELVCSGMLATKKDYPRLNYWIQK